MVPILPPPKSPGYLQMSLLMIFLQLLVPGSSAELVVKEKDFEDLQLDQVQAQAHLVEDTIVPFQCRRQVNESGNTDFFGKHCHGAVFPFNIIYFHQ